MKKITRTIKMETVNMLVVNLLDGSTHADSFQHVEFDNDKEREEYVGRFNTAELRFIVTGYSVVERLYAISVKKFLENAEVVER